MAANRSPSCSGASRPGSTLRHVPGKTLAVTHASIIRAATVHALRAPADSFWRIDVAPLSVMKLSRAGEQWTLSSLGEPLT